jgi:hypothetical protein
MTARRRADARQPGTDNQAAGITQTANRQQSIPRQLIPSHRIAQARPAVYLADPPLASLGALLETDASPTEIRRRLRLNMAIRCLLDAVEEMEAAS